MKCPHCRAAFHEVFTETTIYDFAGNALRDKNGYWLVTAQVCPECGNAIVFLVNHEPLATVVRGTATKEIHSKTLVYPRAPSRPIPSSDIPDELSSDFIEASLVLADSPKASAALSRRCLQALLRNHAGVKHGKLVEEIEELLNSGKLPSHIAKAVDAVRNIGNFAAHPEKNQQTGQIVDVEPGEAEWLLDTLEALFDFYFVQPKLLERKREELDAKLKDAGKKPMK